MIRNAKPLIFAVLLAVACGAAATAQVLNVATLRGVVTSAPSCDTITAGTPGPITFSLPDCAGVVPGVCIEVTGQVSNDVTTSGTVISVVGRVWAILPDEECTGDYDVTVGWPTASKTRKQRH